MATTVTSRELETRRAGYYQRPIVVARLSGGRVLEVAWDSVIAARNLTLYRDDECERGEAATAEATGLDAETIESLVDEVYEAQRRADEEDGVEVYHPCKCRGDCRC